MRKLFGAVGVVAATAVLAVPSASAASTEIGLAGCIFGSGQRTVAAGDDVTVRLGWLDRGAGMVRQFLDAVDVTLAVDGEDVPDAEQYFGPIERVENVNVIGRGFVSHLRYNLGALEPGESVVVSIVWTLEKAIPATLEDGKVVKVGPGEIVNGTCTITAV